MNELVNTIPEGVYYNSLVKNGDSIQIKGTAQSNARVSALMRNFEESMWFKDPNLQVINVKGTAGGRLSDFSLSVRQGSGTEADIRRALHQAVKASQDSKATEVKPVAPATPAGEKS
jgi:type IV pilus assembly protein PilN